jgi:hypothetical protein
MNGAPGLVLISGCKLIRASFTYSMPTEHKGRLQTVQAFLSAHHQIRHRISCIREQLF